MKDWIEFIVVVALAAMSLAVPVIASLEGVETARAVAGLALSWCGVMVLVLDWPV